MPYIIFFLFISCEYTQWVLAKCLLGVNFFKKIKILHHNALYQAWEHDVPEINIPSGSFQNNARECPTPRALPYMNAERLLLLKELGL